MNLVTLGFYHPLLLLPATIIMPRSKQIKKIVKRAAKKASKTSRKVAKVAKVVPLLTLKEKVVVVIDAVQVEVDIPKRPLNGYMRFRKQVYEKVKSENPDQKITEYAKLIGVQWNALTDVEKAPYKEAFEKENVMYAKAIAALPPGTVLRKTKSKHGKDKKKKDPNAPKRPLNGYMRFRKQVYEKVKSENPDQKITEYARLIGVMWKALTDTEQAPYNEAFKKEMVTYKAALEAYNASLQATPIAEPVATS